MAVHDEIWAVDAERIRVFFRGRDRDVRIIPLPDRKMGPVAVPQTRIIIGGEEADELYHAFFLHFMTAGG